MRLAGTEKGPKLSAVRVTPLVLGDRHSRRGFRSGALTRRARLLASTSGRWKNERYSFVQQIRHPLGTVAKSRQHFQSCVSISWRNADLFLKGAYSAPRVSTDPAVRSPSIKTAPGEASLDLLDFGERQRALASAELLIERTLTPDAVAEMNDCKRIRAGGVVRPHGVKIPGQEKRWSTCCWSPQPRALIQTGKRLARC